MHAPTGLSHAAEHICNVSTVDGVYGTDPAHAASVEATSTDFSGTAPGGGLDADPILTFWHLRRKRASFVGKNYGVPIP